MPRIVRCSIIQASNAVAATEPLAMQKQAMIDKHLGLIRKAASDGAHQKEQPKHDSAPYDRDAPFAAAARPWR